MARKKREYRRREVADNRFGDPLVAKFINCMMWNGKKSVAENILYGAFDTIRTRWDREGMEVFQKAIENVRPLVEVRSRRVGGATYQVPTEVRPVRRDALAIRWIVSSARERSEKGMVEKLACELFEAAQHRGNAIKKKEEAHRMAEANRAFAHYRW